MNKNAIKKFAIDARNKLIASVTDKAGMLGITPDNCSEAITKGADFEVYKTAAGTEVTLNTKQCEQRRKLVDQIHARGFEAVVEEVAYTWFNRICAIRFMEVNDYMYPVRVRVLSSEKEGKNEPDVVTMAPDIDWDFTDKEREEIIDAKMNNRLDDLFRMLFIKQCNLLHEVLPGLFEETENYTEMLLNISFTNEDDVIRMLIDDKRGIPEEDFNVNTIGEDGQPTGQVEIIGWLYQYYNTELKDDTFAKLKKNVKITKERIPAATQLFTPDWIVRYMVENSVGRIWIEHLRAVDSSIDEKATAERFGWKYYLSEAEQEENVSLELAKIRKDYIDLTPEDITCIDPCMGSGHILVAMFDILMDIYENAGYDRRDAAFKIVKRNIHGLDIDQRAYQLAYFAVMMKGRGYNRRFLSVKNVKPNVYRVQGSGYTDSTGIRKFVYDEATLDYFVNNNATLKRSMDNLSEQILNAEEYGSILKVENVDFNLIFERFKEIEEEISLYKNSVSASLYPFVVTAYMLNKKYDVVITNPPYLSARGSMSSVLTKYLTKHYPVSKNDLFTVFMEVCEHMTKNTGFYSMVNQQSWMFLAGFAKLREKIYEKDCFINLIHIGAGAFEGIAGEVVQSVAFLIRKISCKEYKASYIDMTKGAWKEQIKGLNHVQHTYYMSINEISNIPNGILCYHLGGMAIKQYYNGKRLDSFADPRVGMATGENELFVRLWFEVSVNKIGYGYKNGKDTLGKSVKWFPYNKGGECRRWYGNRMHLVDWEEDGKNINAFKQERLMRGEIEKKNSECWNRDYYFMESISWSKVSSGRFAVRYYEPGFIFDVAGCSILGLGENLYYVMGMLNSELRNAYVESLSPTLNFETGAIKSFPVIIKQNKKEIITKIVKECIKLEEEDWNSFETSWDFKCHPLISVISKNRALFDDITDIDLAECYTCWENECNERFNQLKANEEELNRIFIDIYSLQDELTPEVEDKDVTVRKADLQRDIKSLVSYAVGCMFGRYSLDEEGLVLAGQPFEAHFFEASAPVCGTGFAGAPGASVPIGEFYYKTDEGVKKCTYNPDKDNIIPICDEEYFSDDIVSRFCEWVKVVYGEKSLETNLDFIAKALGNKGNTSREVIRNYFLNDFFKDHCNTYSVTGSGKRPIYWLFDSGKQNGFKALIYMHRYDADTVGRVRTDYLHKAQKYVETAMQSAQYTIDNATSASEKSKATKAVTKYTKQLAEMKIYDEAIAHVANQRIEIDLDDGVKVNYAKFQGVEVAQEGKKALKVDLLAKI